MADIPSIAFFPIIFFGIIAIIIVLAILNSSKSLKVKTRYVSPDFNPVPMNERYVAGQFSQQMELDMRLPYRRFKKLYPGSNITYEEYKQMQMKSAFRRSMSSQDNKRMVR